MNKISMMACCAAALAFLAAGCRTVEPPERPVAYVFPTVRTFDGIGELQGRPVAEADVRRWLARTGIYDELRGSGMRDEDWRLLVRGLARGGYAEIDARKAGLNIRWVTISLLDDERTEVMVGYGSDGGENMRAGMVWQKQILDETRRRCAMPGLYVSESWYGRTGATEREYITMRTLDGTRPALWIKRLVFLDAKK